MPALLIVMRHLQQRGGLARVHRGITEIQFGHMYQLAEGAKPPFSVAIVLAKIAAGAGPCSGSQSGLSAASIWRVITTLARSKSSSSRLALPNMQANCGAMSA